MKKQLKNFFSNLATYVQNQATISTNKRYQQEQLQKQQQQVIQQQQFENAIRQFMYDMRIDLFEAFQNKSYSKLKPIRIISDIRLRGYKIKDNTIFYAFSLDKQVDEPIVHILLDKIKQDMNHDIYSKAREIAEQCGYGYLQLCHPFLWYGIYVVAITDNRADVTIWVVTNLS